MDIKETAEGIVNQAKTALDKNADGKIEVKEVADAVVDRVKETAVAAAEAAEEVKKGFDADADGKVSFDEVKAVAEGVAQKATGAVGGLVDKISGKE